MSGKFCLIVQDTLFILLSICLKPGQSVYIVLLACIDALCHSQQIFCMPGQFPVFLGYTSTKQWV